MMSQRVAALFHYLLSCYGGLPFPPIVHSVAGRQFIAGGWMYAKADLCSTTCEVVAFFDDEDELHDVVEELQIVGFDHAEISVMPSRKVVEKIMGHELRTVVEVADDPDVPRAVPVDRGSLGLAQGALVAGPFYVASCGAAMAFAASGADLATVAMAGIAGGTLGAALGIFPMIWMTRLRRQRIEDLLGHGGLVLWVHISDKKREELARMILARHPTRELGSGSLLV
jgi:hypothetical protein